MSYILCLNCGTSSVKYGIYDYDTHKQVCKGIVERVGIGDSRLQLATESLGSFSYEKDCNNHQEAIRIVLQALTGELNKDFVIMQDINEIRAVGHRVLHGGEKFTKSALISDEVYKTIEEMVEFGPLHNPANLAGIDAVAEILPELPQVAVFDTAFFQTLPPEAFLYGAPYEWYSNYKIRKYGFHGTSHLYLTKRVGRMLGKNKYDINIITLHIGNGISLTAVKNGVAVEHSMGISPLDGVMMGTRSGSVDPSIIPFICKKEEVSCEKVVNVLLNKKSGLFGYTGLTDMRDIEKGMREGDEICQLAHKVYCYKLQLFLGAYLSIMAYDVDALVFSGGVGENAFLVRQEIIKNFEPVGIKLDQEKNKVVRGGNREEVISASESKIPVLVIPTDEEQVILEDVIGILNGNYDVHTNFKYSFE